MNSINKSCLYCKSLVVNQTDEVVLDLKKFRHPEMFNDKRCIYKCLFDLKDCEEHDWYCHDFEEKIFLEKEDDLKL